MADSILKDIYNDIYAALIKIPEFENGPSFNVDLFKNQIASIEDFPFALIDFPYIYYKDASAKIQLGNAMVRVMLCFDSTLLTGPAVTSAFELKEKVFVNLQGGRKRILPDPAYDLDDKPKYSPMTRGTERTETKYAGKYVFEMDFYTTIQDDGLYILKNYVNANDPLVNSNIDLEDDDTTNDHIQLDLTRGDGLPETVEEEEEEEDDEDDLGQIDLMVKNPDNKHNELRTGKIV